MFKCQIKAAIEIIIVGIAIAIESYNDLRQQHQIVAAQRGLEPQKTVFVEYFLFILLAVGYRIGASTTAAAVAAVVVLTTIRTRRPAAR